MPMRVIRDAGIGGVLFLGLAVLLVLVAPVFLIILIFSLFALSPPGRLSYAGCGSGDKINRLLPVPGHCRAPPLLFNT